MINVIIKATLLTFLLGAGILYFDMIFSTSNTLLTDINYSKQSYLTILRMDGIKYLNHIGVNTMSLTTIMQHDIKSINTTQRNHQDFTTVSVRFITEEGDGGEITFFIDNKENLDNIDLAPSQIIVVD